VCEVIQLEIGKFMYTMLKIGIKL